MTNINLTESAYRALNDLQTSNGTYTMYKNMLDRVFLFFLHASSELGMSDFEAIDTLRSLDMLRNDLRALAGAARHAEALSTTVVDFYNLDGDAEVAGPRESEAEAEGDPERDTDDALST